MSDNSKIEWTDATWNPITGCSEQANGEETEPLDLAMIRVAGDACPNGCAASERWEPFSPELLRSNDDGELSCPTCWDVFPNA